MSRTIPLSCMKSLMSSNYSKVKVRQRMEFAANVGSWRWKFWSKIWKLIFEDWNTKLDVRIKNYVLSRKMKLRSGAQLKMDLEVPRFEIKFEAEVWNWSLKLKFEVNAWSWSLRLKLKVQVHSWWSNMKFEFEKLSLNFKLKI